MEERRKKQIINEIANEFKKAETKFLDVSISPQDVEEFAISTASAISLNIFIKSGNNQPTSYIGRRKICLELKKQLGGKVRRIDYYWLWIGKDNNNRAKSIINKLV